MISITLLQFGLKTVGLTHIGEHGLLFAIFFYVSRPYLQCLLILGQILHFANFPQEFPNTNVVETNALSPFISGDVCIQLCLLIDSLTSYIILGWQYFPLKLWKHFSSLQSVLEKPNTILIPILLYVIFLSLSLFPVFYNCMTYLLIYYTRHLIVSFNQKAHIINFWDICLYFILKFLHMHLKINFCPVGFSYKADVELLRLFF